MSKDEYYIMCYLRDSAFNRPLNEESKRGYVLYLKLHPELKPKKPKK